MYKFFSVCEDSGRFGVTVKIFVTLYIWTKIICECIELDINIEYTTSFIKEYKTENYIDLRTLVNAKKEIATQFENYTQVFGDKYGYLNKLSILDLLFNEGPNTLNYLESQASFW